MLLELEAEIIMAFAMATAMLIACARFGRGGLPSDLSGSGPSPGTS